MLKRAFMILLHCMYLIEHAVVVAPRGRHCRKALQSRLRAYFALYMGGAICHFRLSEQLQSHPEVSIATKICRAACGHISPSIYVVQFVALWIERAVRAPSRGRHYCKGLLRRLQTYFALYLGGAVCKKYGRQFLARQCLKLQLIIRRCRDGMLRP